MRYDILLFDADNTILDFDQSEEQALQKAFEVNGLPFSDYTLSVYRRNNIRQWELYEKGVQSKDDVLINRFIETFDELGLSKEQILSVSKLYELYLKDGFFVVDYAKEVLEYLKQFCRLYLVTNGVLEIQNSRMSGSGMDKYFIKRFVSEEVGFPKPQKGFFDYCFERIDGFDRAKTLLIGDSLTSDIQGGINANIDTCWFNPNKIDNNTPFKSTYVIDDLRKLINIVCD